MFNYLEKNKVFAITDIDDINDIKNIDKEKE